LAQADIAPGVQSMPLPPLRVQRAHAVFPKPTFRDASRRNFHRGLGRRASSRLWSPVTSSQDPRYHPDRSAIRKSTSRELQKLSEDVQNGEMPGLSTVFDAHSRTHSRAHAGGGILMSAGESEWDVVLSAAAVRASDSGPQTVAGLGLHPWYVKDAADGWYDRLRTMLVAHPSAVVGEIGLDRVRASEKSEVEAQMQAFRLQLELAASLQRPVCVHCVKAVSLVVDVLGNLDVLPPRLAMHSFGGSVESMREILRIGAERGCLVFFGYSWAVNGKRAGKRLRASVVETPLERLLIESDLEDPANVETDLGNMATFLADTRGLSVADLVRVVNENGRRFIATRDGSAV